MLGPAGTLHLSLDDVATYLRDHMNGEAGAGSLLRAETYQHLHKAIGDSYALGWVDDGLLYDVEDIFHEFELVGGRAVSMTVRNPDDKVMGKAVRVRP